MAYRILVTLAVVSLAVLCPSTFAYPTGAPSTACASMYPYHNFTAQTSVAPFMISVNSSCYTPGTQIKVTLRSNDSTTQFAGFLMQARKPGESSSSYGVFSAAGNPTLQPLSCFGVSDNSITHNQVIDSTQSNFTWTAPTSLTGNIVLTTTVVEETDEFWVQSVTFTLSPCQVPNNGAEWRAYSVPMLLVSSLVCSLALAGHAALD